MFDGVALSFECERDWCRVYLEPCRDGVLDELVLPVAVRADIERLGRRRGAVLVARLRGGRDVFDWVSLVVNDAAVDSIDIFRRLDNEFRPRGLLALDIVDFLYRCGAVWQLVRYLDFDVCVFVLGLAA